MYAGYSLKDRMDLKILQDRHIIHQCQRIEDVKFGLVANDKRITNKVLQSSFQAAFFFCALFESDVCGVIEQVCSF